MIYFVKTVGCKSSQCHHHCISVRQTSRCSCAIGFQLNDDLRSCDTSQYIVYTVSKTTVAVLFFEQLRETLVDL